MIAKFKQSNFYLEFMKLLEEMKPMTGKQRVDHLWTYYKEYLWFVALAVIVICVVVTSLINTSKNAIASGMLVNISIEQAGFEYLCEDYREHLGGVGNDVVELDYTNFSSLADPTSSEDNYYASMILLARVSSGDLDYIILDQFGMEYYITQGVYLDLREFFTQEELDALGEKVIYARQEDETESWAVAVDISDLPFVQQNISTEEKTYFALSGSTRRLDVCRDMWEYLHAWQPGETE